jgi:DNA-directed RNA polymerase specialized sigma24 family protein
VHYLPLVGIATLLTGESGKAEEIVQEGFASLRRVWPSLRDDEKALGYLRRAVVTLARARSAPSAGRPVRPRRAGKASRAGIPGTSLLAVLPSLPALQREALVLKYHAGWPDRQVAAAMGISKPALRTHTRRGISAVLPVLALDQERPERTP